MLSKRKHYNFYRNLCLRKIKDFDIKNHINGLIEVYGELYKTY